RDPDDVRARDLGLRPDVPGDDLAAVHGAGGRLRAVPDGLPRRAHLAGVGHAPPPVRDERGAAHHRRLTDNDLADEHEWRRVPGRASAQAETGSDDDTAASAPAADDD